MPELAPLMLRAVAVSFAAVLAMALAASTRRARTAMLPLIACLVSYLLRSAPEITAWPALAVQLLSLGALLFPVALWWLVHNAFEDRSDFPWAARVGTVVLLISGWVPGAASHSLQKASAATFVLVALWQVWATRNEDLVDGRRTARSWLLGYAGGHGLVVLAVELVLQGASPPTWLDALNLSAIVLALAITLAFFVRADPALLKMLLGEPRPSVDEIEPTPDPEPEEAKREPDALAALQTLMTVDHAYRDPELSLKGLALRLTMPEYRLRELINQALGFRNFPAFLNHYRLNEVEARMNDPALDRRPILTLALEAGFGSIGPFNRAFRERHGITPTEFRKQRGLQPSSARTR